MTSAWCSRRPSRRAGWTIRSRASVPLRARRGDRLVVVGGHAVAGERRGQVLQRGARVADQRQRAVLVRVGGVHVDGDEAHAGAWNCVFDAVVKSDRPRAEDEHEVGVGGDAVGGQRAGDADRAQAARVRLGQRALARLGHRHRDARAPRRSARSAASASE